MRMTKDEFTGSVLELVREKAGGDFEVSLDTHEANNGVLRNGITMWKGQETIRPKAYLDGHYDAYLGGSLSVEEAAADIYGELMEGMADAPLAVADILTCWEKAEPLIFPKLVNTGMNKEALETMPSREFLDLSVSYQICLCDFGDSKGYVRVKSQHMQLWGKTEEDLYRAAMANMRRDGGSRFRSIYETVESILSASPQDGEALGEVAGDWNPSEAEKFKMYVLTNRAGTFGASQIIDSETLETVHGRIGDFIVLPSSIHEVIIVPDDKRATYQEMAGIVGEVNGLLAREDYLSGHVYAYGGDGKGLRIVA